jgi:hypothetical protein
MHLYDNNILNFFVNIFVNNTCGVRFEVFTAVTIKKPIFLDVAPCGSCKNRRFGGT